MKYPFSLTTLAAVSSIASAFSHDLYARYADQGLSPYFSKREAQDYLDSSIDLIEHTRRSLEARFDAVNALEEAHIEARDEANGLLARAAFAFPEAFALPKGFKVPKDKAACTALRSKLTTEYHANEEEYNTKKRDYARKADAAVAAELAELARKVVTGRKRAQKVAEAEGCAADGGAHQNEINTWEQNVYTWDQLKKRKNA